jgi:hypothetical protein
MCQVITNEDIFMPFFPGDDMALLSLVNHTIITHGTFGMWSAFLAGSARVILPAGYEKDMSGPLKANISGWTVI